MAADNILTAHEPPRWSTLQKAAFRFAFLFIGLNTIFGYNIIDDIFYPRYDKWVAWTSIFAQPLYWLDTHFYHIGTNLGQYQKIGIDDKPTGWVLLITVSWLSLLGSAVWSVADINRTNYQQLNYWFKTYLAYYLSLSFLFYAVYKIIPVQMPFPNAAALLQPMGEKTKINILFEFMGISPGYSMFTGICELLAAVLVLIRRTRVLGLMLMTAIVSNIVSLNLFYNVYVKLLTIQLLFICLYMLAPYISRLIAFFIRQQPVSLAEKQYTFSTPWKKYAINGLLIIPVWVTLYLFVRAADLQKTTLNLAQQKFYSVTGFVRGHDTLPPLLTDTFRIKALLFTAYYTHRYAVIYTMQDSAVRYEYVIDSTKKLLSFKRTGDKQVNEFHYQTFGNEFKLDGQWHNQNVSVLLKKIPVGNLQLLKEKTTWIQRNL